MAKLFEVDIFGLKVPVVSEDGMLQKSNTFGYADFDKNQIVIDTDLKKELFIRTLMHEMIHFLFFRLNLEINETIEEQLCECVALCLSENLNIKLPRHLRPQPLPKHPTQEET